LLLELALQRREPNTCLTELDDRLEKIAHQTMVKRLLKQP